MPRTPARFTQSDVARCIRAVKQCAADDMRVRVQRDGSIVIEKDTGSEINVTADNAERPKFIL